MRNPAFCICENKDTDQLCSNCAADQRLCFRYTFSTIPLLPKYLDCPLGVLILWQREQLTKLPKQDYTINIFPLISFPRVQFLAWLPAQSSSSGSSLALIFTRHLYQNYHLQRLDAMIRRRPCLILTSRMK